MEENTQEIENLEDLHREGCKEVFRMIHEGYAPAPEILNRVVHDRDYKVFAVSEKGNLVLGLCESEDNSRLVLFPHMPIEGRDRVIPVLWTFECRNSRFNNRAYQSFRYLELVMCVVSQVYALYTNVISSKYSPELVKKLEQSGK